MLEPSRPSSNLSYRSALTADMGDLSQFIVIIERGAGYSQLGNAASPDKSMHNLENHRQGKRIDIAVRCQNSKNLSQALVRPDEERLVHETERNGPQISGGRCFLPGTAQQKGQPAGKEAI